MSRAAGVRLMEWLGRILESEMDMQAIILAVQSEWQMAEADRRDGLISTFAAEVARRAVAAERDCRTCKNWTPHHRSDVMHCSAALRCVAGSSYRRQGMVQLWEAAPVDAGF